MEQNTGLLRNTVDKYYTNKDVVSECMNFFSTYIDFNKKEDLFIEPSAGNGSFIPYIKHISDNHIFYDIEPDHEDVIQQDYLYFDYESITSNKSYNQIHIVGNPPFFRFDQFCYCVFIQLIARHCVYLDIFLYNY